MSEIPTPTPTQAENDALKTGEMHPDEKGTEIEPVVADPKVSDAGATDNPLPRQPSPAEPGAARRR